MLVLTNSDVKQIDKIYLNPIDLTEFASYCDGECWDCDDCGGSVTN